MIYAEINGQRIENLKYDAVVADSINYLTLKLKFNKEWSGYAPTAVFYHTDADKGLNVVIHDDMQCDINEFILIVPFEVIKVPGFKFSVYGTNGESRITTDEAFVFVKESGMRETTMPDDPTLTEYEQILAIATSAKDIAQAVQNDANSGKFIGEKGDKGDKGDKGSDGKDYVLTDLDKSEIANIVVEILPDGDEVSY